LCGSGVEPSAVLKLKVPQGLADLLQDAVGDLAAAEGFAMAQPFQGKLGGRKIEVFRIDFIAPEAAGIILLRRQEPFHLFLEELLGAAVAMVGVGHGEDAGQYAAGVGEINVALIAGQVIEPPADGGVLRRG